MILLIYLIGAGVGAFACLLLAATKLHSKGAPASFTDFLVLVSLTLAGAILWPLALPCILIGVAKKFTPTIRREYKAILEPGFEWGELREVETALERSSSIGRDVAAATHEERLRFSRGDPCANS